MNTLRIVIGTADPASWLAKADLSLADRFFGAVADISGVAATAQDWWARDQKLGPSL